MNIQMVPITFKEFINANYINTSKDIQWQTWESLSSDECREFMGQLIQFFKEIELKYDYIFVGETSETDAWHFNRAIELIERLQEFMAYKHLQETGE